MIVKHIVTELLKF